MLAGVTELTETQTQILQDGKSHYNSLIQGRPNDGQTLGLIILMLHIIDATDCESIQGILITATKDAAIRTFEKANQLSQRIGIRCGLVEFESKPAEGHFHWLIETAQALSKYVEFRISPKMVLFDDANKSVYYKNQLLGYANAKYLCVSSYITEKLEQSCIKDLKALPLKRPMETILSKNLRHYEFFCDSRFEKLIVCIELCGWSNAKQIIIFVQVYELSLISMAKFYLLF